MALSNLTKVQTVGIGSNIEVVGVVTTGQFKSGTSNLHSTGVELTNLNVSGIATIGGNLSIGGTLTYQDVTNVDSVGIITAQDAGINVSGGTGTFAGDVSIADKIIHTGDTNTALRFPAADTITAETGGSERLRITAAGLVGVNCTPVGMFEVQKNGVPAIIANYNNQKHLQMGAGGSGAGFHLTDGNFFTINHQPYANRGTDSNLTERLRITSAGKVNIGDNQMSSNLLNIEDGTAAAIDIASHGTGGDTAYIGVKKSSGGGLTFGISNRDIIFKTGASYSSGTTFDSGTERLRITSGGNVNIGGNYTQTTYPFQLTGSGGGEAAAMAIKNEGSHPAKLHLMSGHGNWSVSNSATVGDAFEIRDESANATRMMITSGGYVTKPNNPAFIAGRTGGNQTFTVGVYPLNVARLNVGNHYNTSTYKFVAPVAGVYYFHGQVYYNNGSGSYRVGIRKTPNGGSSFMLNTAGHEVVGNDDQQSTSIIESMAVGDAVDLFCDSNVSMQCYYNINDTTYGAHTYFMGYLIG